MLLRKLFLKLKRKLFYFFHGFYPEQLKDMVKFQMILESLSRNNVSFREQVKKEFQKIMMEDTSENKCNN